MSVRELPEDFKSMLRSYGQGEVTERLIAALENSEPSLSIHANALKGMMPLPEYEAVPLLGGVGCYLAERPLFAADAAWHQGLYYVQDASSMAFGIAVERIVAQYFGSEALRYLDACAAPGGKTISAIEKLPADSAVLANEYERKRAGVLLENLAKQGFPNIAVSNMDGAALSKLGAIFDIVAVDAPCSGEGMMRKEAEAVRQWSRGLIESCASTQRDILRGVWETLKPGGVIIYSTCTFNRDENEENVSFIVEELGGESIDLQLSDFPGVVGGFNTAHHCYRFMPGHVRGEGLFLAALRKPSDDESVRLPKIKFAKSKKNADVERFAAKHVQNADDYIAVATGSDLYCLYPRSHAEFFGYLTSKLRLLRCGMPLCHIKGKDLLPAWELSFSSIFRYDSMPTLPTDHAAAMSYVHGDSIANLPDGLEKGIILATYKDVPLGFAKNIGQRANNLYPEALRLRMGPSAATPQKELVIKRI